MELKPHPYYTEPEFAWQRERDAANEAFAAVLAEACRRMCAEHEGKAAEAEWWAERAERFAHRGGDWRITSSEGRGVLFWRTIAEKWRAEARNERELAQIYRWHGLLLTGCGLCTCRFPQHCPDVPAASHFTAG